MIKVRRTEFGVTEEMELSEFEERARRGDISPGHWVNFSAITGERFVRAAELDLFRGLYAAGDIAFQRYFHLARFPWVTVTCIVALVAIFFGWQGGTAYHTDTLLQQGAKSRALIVELGHWWRLLTANVLHFSTWHLAANCIFLFNLGGPAEAVYRRLDYGLILIASALGTNLLSALANPSISCGASGVVFGVWGAAAVFGIRHRDLLPDKYRRYFIFNVIPYSVFALYSGFAMEGVDNWSHLGGLLAGAGTAMFLPARLLEPNDRAAPTKTVVVAGLLLALAAAAQLPAGPGALNPERIFAGHGLRVSVPSRWDLTLQRHKRNRDTHVFENDAGVILAVETVEEERPVAPDTLGDTFVGRELAGEVDVANVQGLRLSDPVAVEVDGLMGQLVRLESVSGPRASNDQFLLLARGYYRYTIRMSTPLWLTDNYRAIFDEVINTIDIIDPQALTAARKNLTANAAAIDHARYAKAVARAGNLPKAREMLTAAAGRWPQSGEVFLTHARLLWQAGTALDEGCDLVRHALDRKLWTPGLLGLAVDLHRACDQPDTAERILATGLERFPNAARLKARVQPEASP